MREHQEDRRVRRTKKLLRQSLTELMLEKDFKDITIRDITERADLNRGTFYLHYSDPYDLLHQIETEVLENLQSLIDDWMPHCERGSEMESLFRTLVDYAAENSALFRCLLENKASSDFFTRIQTLITTNGREMVKTSFPNANLDNCEYFFSFICFGLNGTLLRWVQQDCSMPRQDLTHMINCIVTAASDRFLGR